MAFYGHKIMKIKIICFVNNFITLNFVTPRFDCICISVALSPALFFFTTQHGKQERVDKNSE